MIYDSQLLKGQSVIWWKRVCRTLGDDAEANMSSEEIVKCIKAKYYAHHDIEKLVDDLFDLKKGELTVEQYTRELSDRLVFIRDILLK